MAQIKKIKSLTQYLSQIENLGAKNNVFFRGHSDCDYELKPGIYRTDKSGKSLVEFEDKIYREIVASAPQEFVGKNTLETLALMQHYDAPTRVLDLSENALVALYFACIGNEKQDGEVLVFDVPDEFVCHYDSDRVTILANLAKCGTEFYYHSSLSSYYIQNIRRLEKLKVAMELHETFDEPNFKMLAFLSDNSENIINKYWDDIYGENFEDIYESFLHEYGDASMSETDMKNFRNAILEILINHFREETQKELEDCNRNYFGKLLHNIREDKSYFDAAINPEDIKSVFAVKSKLDNPRIAKQHGAFFIFGVQPTYFSEYGDYKPMAIFNFEWILKGKGDSKIIIDKKSKLKILQELESLGFNQASLFPEVDKVAGYIKSKYLNRQ